MISRFELSKMFHGGLEGTGVGIMLSGGDPRAGAAGYVAMEAVRGRLDGREGGFLLHQFGTMRDGVSTLRCEIVPDSGDGDLAGFAGVRHRDVLEDGTHRFALDYEL